MKSKINITKEKVSARLEKYWKPEDVAIMVNKYFDSALRICGHGGIKCVCEFIVTIDTYYS
jgi:hypothetical protein